MKSWLILVIALIGFVPGWRPPLRGAEADEEQRGIEVLRSNAGLAEKDAACARLKFIGTSRCVPALAALLTDEQLSHSARYALEAMRIDEASGALLEALDKTSGLIRLGIINSLGAREEARALPPLVQLLRDQDIGTASAAARALGQIGNSEAAKALRTCSQTAAAALHDAAVDGLLRCANRMLSSGERSGAMAIFEQLDASPESDPVRVAAFKGRILASGNAGLGLVLHAISGPAGPSRVAALQLVRDLQAPNATIEFAGLLPDLPPAIQIALIGGLAQRGDPSALPALASLAGKSQSDVRLAVVRAFDDFGDPSVIGLLSTIAGSSSGDEQRAARQALADLRRGDITGTLLEVLSSASPQEQAEIARALGARGDKAAVPKLLDLAQRGPDSTRKSALQALSVLSDNSQLAALVNLVVQAKDKTGRAQAAEALNAACQRIQTQRGHADTEPLIQGIEKGSTEARAALLSICGGLIDPKARTTLRIALNDQDPQVHAAAVRAVCDTPDAELLPDVLELARLTPQDSVRTLAINGAVRLLTQEETVKLTTGQRVTALKSLLGVATQPEQKRKVLAGLGEVADVEALRVVDSALTDKELSNEAAQAAVKIASTLPASQAEASAATLTKALAAATDAGTRQAAQAALSQIQERAEYLTSWEVAGPYQQDDKDFAALFDIAFGPESKAAKTVKWIPLAAATDPKRPWVMDLLKTLGGQQCVAYARTWVHSDQQQGAMLELGSDDGVKVWLNDKQVYALNVARPLQPGSDKVKITLHPGWNPLLLKITQNNQGWEFCVRVRSADGAHLEGLRCDSAPKNAAAEK